MFLPDRNQNNPQTFTFWQAEALEAAVEFMVHKYGSGPGVYEKWRQFFQPVCDAERRRQGILKRFQIEYRVNVNDYERSLQVFIFLFVHSGGID